MRLKIEKSTSWVKYLPLLAILVAHQVFRFVDAKSINQPFSKVVGGQGGINDSFWYLGIAQHGYAFAPGGVHEQQSSWAFYPLFPNLISVGHHLGINAIWGGLIMVTIVAWLASIQLSRLITRKYGLTIGYTTALLFVGQFYALSLVSIMTESLFALFVFSALLTWFDKKYNQTALFVFLACITKSFGVALAIAVLVSAILKLKKNQETIKNLSLAMLSCALSPVIWIVVVAIKFQSLGAYFAIQRKGWGNQFDFGFGFLSYLQATLFGDSYTTSWQYIVDFIVLTTLILVVWMLFFKVPVEWKIFVVVCAYLSLAHRSWHLADARFMTAIGIPLFPIAVTLQRFKPIFKYILLVLWFIPSFYLSSIYTSGF